MNGYLGRVVAHSLLTEVVSMQQLQHLHVIYSGTALLVDLTQGIGLRNLQNDISDWMARSHYTV